MKANFLKLAGVKNEEEFYKKFPTEEAFMAKYGKQLKKAAPGIITPKAIKPLPVNIAAPKIDVAAAKSIAANASKGSKKGIFDSISQGFKNLSSEDAIDLGTGLANSLGGIMGGIDQMKAEKKQLAELQKYGQVSNIAAQAAASKPIDQPQQKYDRPEKYLTNPMYALGRQGDIFLAENGAEIQNTYAPDVMYTDLGYEPLNDSNKMKDFKKGGKLKKAVSGTSQVLGAVGSAAALIPGIGTAASIGLPLLGTAYDLLFPDNTEKQIEENKKKIQDNINSAQGQAAVMASQAQNKSFMEDGGWVSNDWQPQVIASFGDHSMKDLLKPDPMMDTLRAGGHLKYYTPPSERAMSTERAEYGTQMAMGGDLQVHRGEAETISYNPYLPNGGETVMFRGPSHDNGGMPISYGENGVEVEGGEPAMVMKDGGKTDNLLVFGNLIDPMNNRKFKNVAADISKKEAKQNKIIDKATSLSNNADENNTFGQIELNSAFASDLGAKMNLKKYAMQKEDLAHRQNAILDTAEEFGIKPEDIGYAKFGGKFEASEEFAAGGKKGKAKAPASPFTKKGQSALKSKTLIPANVFAPKGKDFLNQVEKEADQANGLNRFYPSGKEKPIDEQTYTNPKEITTGAFRDVLSPEARGVGSNVYEKFNPYEGQPAKKESKSKDALANILRSAYSSVYPFIRPTAAQPLDPNQLAPEMLAMSMNQEEPVQAQLYNPMLTQATSISLQDQLNEITSGQRAAERMTPYNPEAAAFIAAQAYNAKNKVLGEQFRMNQAEKQRVGEQNINTLNDAQQKNLAILDQAYTRKAQGKSNTKQQAIEIAKSIADKYAKNKLENKQARVMENMYPAFNFTQEGIAYKNPAYLAGFGPGMSGSKSSGKIQGLPNEWMSLYDDEGNFQGTKKKKESEVKNGGIVKSFKNF